MRILEYRYRTVLPIKVRVPAVYFTHIFLTRDAKSLLVSKGKETYVQHVSKVYLAISRL